MIVLMPRALRRFFTLGALWTWRRNVELFLRSVSVPPPNWTVELLAHRLWGIVGLSLVFKRSVANWRTNSASRAAPSPAPSPSRPLEQFLEKMAPHIDPVEVAKWMMRGFMRWVAATEHGRCERKVTRELQASENSRREIEHQVHTSLPLSTHYWRWLTVCSQMESLMYDTERQLEAAMSMLTTKRSSTPTITHLSFNSIASTSAHYCGVIGPGGLRGRRSYCCDTHSHLTGRRPGDS